MAAPDYNESFRYQAMSASSLAQDIDVSAPLSPVAQSFQQHQRWQHGHYQAFYDQNYEPFCPPTSQYRSNQPYHVQDYTHSPYNVHAGYRIPTHHPPSMFPHNSHQPRPPPAIRTPAIESLMGIMNSSRSSADVYRGGLPNFGSHHTGYQPLATGPSPYAMPSEPAAMSQNMLNESFDVSQFGRTTSGGGSEQNRRVPFLLCPPQSSQHPQPYQHQQQQTNRNAGNRHPDDTERRSTDSHTTPARHSDRGSSPRTSARRSYDRYSGDILQSSTSSDAEEAAARSPPSNRMRHRRRESRPQPRFFSSQFRDPNEITTGQIQELKTNLIKLLINELPEDASPTCDICAKDYSATHEPPSEEEEVAVKLPCGHFFGEFCIGQWFDTCRRHKNKVTCPMCRKQLIQPPKPSYAPGYYHMYDARIPRSFQELVAEDLQARYARA